MGPFARRPARLALVPLLIALTIALAGCSPEGARVRGEGAGTGADPGNRDQDVEMHGEVDQNERIYYQTPTRQPVEQR